MGQKFPITGETFDPYKGDAPGFTLKHQRDAKPLPEQPRKTYHVKKSAAASVREQALAEEGPDEMQETEYGPQSHLAQQQTATADYPRTMRPLAAELNPRGMRRAMVLSEILAPPLALRGRR